MIKISQQIYNSNSLRKKTRLNDLIKLYEINYLKFNKILPNILRKNSASFSLPEGEKSSAVNIKVLKESKYTSKLIVCQTNFSINNMEDMIMEVAIYHDLKMIEVRRFNGKHQFWARNVFPNKNMLSKDEKYQWNKYLSEWLSFVAREGLSNLKIIH
jgi:hypothetical protein